MIRIFKQRRLIPVEERRYGAIFVVCAALLAVTTVWAVVDEVWVRRPWKAYQQEFNELELQKAIVELRKAEQQFQSREVQTRYSEFQRQLQTAEVALESNEYRILSKELEEIESHISEISRKLQFTRSESDEVYYRYKSALHRGKKAERQKQQLDHLEREKEKLSGELAKAQQRRSTLQKQIRGFVQQVESLRDSLTTLRADVLSWQRKIEAIRARKIEVKQVVLPEFDSNNFGARIARVERCITCHVAVDQPGFEREQEPFRRHSYMIDYHPVETFGCTPCHGGQGVALTVKAAHGQVEFWPNPLLGEGTRERLCGKCHQEGIDFPEAPALSDGRELFETSGCLGCHNVEGYVRVPNIGPPLNHIALKAKPDWLLRWILNPKNYLPKTKMPNFRFDEERARAIRAYFLEASAQKPGAARITPKHLSKQWVQEGETLFRVARCISCHSVDGVGGTIAPDLGRVAEKVRLDWLFDWIKNPRAYQPNTKMPQYRFTDREILLIIAYLTSLTNVNALEEQRPLSFSPAEIKRGEKLMVEYGCLGCHDPVGQEAIGGKVGADLTFFGDKPIENFDFGDVLNIPRTKEAWVEAKLQNPRVFSTERIQLKMPDFGLGRQQAGELTTMLLGFTEEHPPDKLIRARVPESNYAPPGEFGKLVVELNCLTCHKINGRGGTRAPDLSYEGSRANAEWLREFFRNPTTLRPTLTVRMPKFNLREREIGILVNYMRTALLHPDIPPDLLRDVKITEKEVELGRELYHEKYRCQSCHQINYEGGTMGPELVSSDSNIRLRRSAGWIYRWIKNPKALDPATVEPGLGLSDEEALLITKYLLSY